MTTWSGIYSVAVTPFTETGAIDVERFLAFVDDSVSYGADGVIVAGSTGEFYTLTAAEKRTLYEQAVGLLSGRGVPVLAGISDLRVDEVIASCVAAVETGCAGGLLLPPIYAMPDAREIEAFYRRVATATPLRLMLYNSPRRAGVDLTPEIVDSLTDLPNVVAIKDSSGSIVRVSELCQRFGGRLDVFVGYETMIRAGLAVGAVGVVAMAHQVAGRLVRRYYDAVLAGEGGQIDRLESALFAVYQCFQSGSYYAAIKATMNALGHEAGDPRPPLLPLADPAVERIRGILSDAQVPELIAELG